MGRVEERARAGNGASKDSDEMAECWRPEGGAIFFKPKTPFTMAKVLFRDK